MQLLPVLPSSPRLRCCVQLLNMSRPVLEAEIVGARASLAACGIPRAAVVGMRTPFLHSKPEVRDVLRESGFLYDR